MLKKQWIFFGLITAIPTIVQEASKGKKNSPYSIIDKVDVDVSTNDSGIKLYELPQSEVDRIERNLRGGSDSDIGSDNDSTLKKKTIDLRPNVAVPGPVERQHD